MRGLNSAPDVSTLAVSSGLVTSNISPDFFQRTAASPVAALDDYDDDESAGMDWEATADYDACKLKTPSFCFHLIHYLFLLLLVCNISHQLLKSQWKCDHLTDTAMHISRMRLLASYCRERGVITSGVPLESG